MEKVTMSDKIGTACLNEKNITGSEGYDCEVSGFGKTGGGCM